MEKIKKELTETIRKMLYESNYDNITKQAIISNYFFFSDIRESFLQDLMRKDVSYEIKKEILYNLILPRFLNREVIRKKAREIVSQLLKKELNQGKSQEFMGSLFYCMVRIGYSEPAEKIEEYLPEFKNQEELFPFILNYIVEMIERKHIFPSDLLKKFDKIQEDNSNEGYNKFLSTIKEEITSRVGENYQEKVVERRDLKGGSERFSDIMLYSNRRLIQEKMKSIETLARGAAHEIRNPMVSISGLVDLLLKKTAENSSEYQDLKVIKDSVLQTLGVVKGLSEFAKLSELKLQSVNINSILDTILLRMKHQLGEKIEVIKDYLEDISLIMVDSDKMTQVFTNIILNSIQAMPNGGKIEVKTRLNENFIEIEIRDTGMGISAENLTKLFEPFFTTKRDIGGTGLGLSISYGIVQQHNGTIEVKSEVGKGTTIIVRLLIGGVK